MLARSSAEIDSPMDASLEIEEDGPGMDFSVDIDDDEVLNDEDCLADIIDLDDKVPEVFNIGADLQNVALPDEVADYIKSLSSETKKLEDELKGCDELLQYSPRKPHVSSAVVLYDDLKDIEEEAKKRGLSVEEFQKEVLSDLKQNEFNEEEVDEEYEEFLQLQREFAELRADVPDRAGKEILSIEGSTASDGGTNIPTPAVAAAQEGSIENGHSKDGETSESDGVDETMALVKYGGDEEVVHDAASTGEVALNAAALSSMRDFIIAQLRRNEEFYERKRLHLVQSIETLRHEEEKEMLRTENRRKEVTDRLREEQEVLRQRRESHEARFEEDMKARQEHVSHELGLHQIEIDRLSEILEEERHQFETNERQWQDRLEETRGKAALKIQKVFRGMRTRNRHSAELAELAELRALRVKEKRTLRLMELEYEIKLRDEETAKSKKEAEEKKKREEEERQKEKEQKEKEEAERIAGLIRKEKERMEEEARQAEIKKRKEEEDEQRKLEEKRRKDEEKKQKEEEKRLKEEEKKRQKEEEKQRKEEEKRKKEEEKRKKEEEKKRKENERRKQKQEEKEQKEKCDSNKEDTNTHQVSTGSAANQKIYETFVSQDNTNSTKVKESLNNGSNNPTSLIESENNSADEGHLDLTQTAGCTTAHTQVASNRTSTKESSVEQASSISSATAATPRNKTPGAESKPASSETVSPAAAHPPPQLQLHQTERAASPAVKLTLSVPAATAAPSTPAETTSSVSTTLTTNPVRATSPSSPSPHPVPASSSPSPAPQPQDCPPPKPSPVELQRLAWIKNCIPWSKVSNEPWKLSQTAGKVHKKPVTAKKLPSVAESVVLAAAQAETLRQVSSVSLCELPGCSLSTLGQCWSLRYVTVTHCGLLCLDGLSQCRHLLYVNAEHNLLEYVDLRDLGSLQVARLAHNNLSSVHGLDGCINLRWLDLGHNSITRIGPGLSPLRRLHTLDLSNNQLVSAHGVEVVVTCQRLLLDHNYLQTVQGLDKMCLLTELSLAGNNLLQVPELKNQVLLQWLNINENSIKSLGGLANSWLPLLHTLTCEKNLLESCEGLGTLFNLEVLDVSSNQISDVESLTPYLQDKRYLARLMVKGNPLIDVFGDEYSTKLCSMLPALKTIDSLQTGHGERSHPLTLQADEFVDPDFLQMCLSQVRMYAQLKSEFDTNIQTLLMNKSVTSETLCGTFFCFCDTSFKMASEYRSAHEYGDMCVSSSIGHFESRQTTAQTLGQRGTNSSLVNGGMPWDERHSNTGQGSGQAVLHKKALFDQAVSGQPSVAPSANGSESLSARSSHREISSTQTSQTFKVQAGLGEKQGPYEHQKSRICSSSKTKVGNQKDKSKAGRFELASKSGHTEVIGQFSSDSDSDGSDVGDYSHSVTEGGSAKSYGTYKHIPHPPAVPPVASYVNEKDKFEIALNSSSANEKPANKLQDFKPGQANNPFAISEKQRFEMALKTTAGMPEVGGRDKFEMALQNSTTKSKHSDPKDKFNGALEKGAAESSNTQGCGLQTGGVLANVVGSQLVEGNFGSGDEFDLTALGLDGEIDLDNLDFDIDKYLDLDMEGLDEFLEKGWRPEDSPQIPHSSYPVLGKINPATESSNIQYHVNRGQGRPPAVPPTHPTLAWRNSPSAEFKGKPLQSPSPAGPAGVKALPPQPSPSPSSVASAAETLGGGTVKSKKDELLDEWGFKDSRTAEMMMARAKKMKWNAERRKKLSKLDPQQRLHLFRKLEESGKIQPVRAPSARVLPRKEYFQAREDEAQRQHLERRVEEQTKVHRTYEWLHTQVGDHPIASSRINAGQAPVYSMNEGGPGRQMVRNNQENRKWSPGSDHLDSVSQAGGSRPRQGRRYSIGDSQYSSQTPLLPPIQVGSAPSSHKGERMSFRDTPVERSGGWGGGKRRGQHK